MYIDWNACEELLLPLLVWLRSTAIVSPLFSSSNASGFIRLISYTITFDTHAKRSLHATWDTRTKEALNLIWFGCCVWGRKAQGRERSSPSAWAPMCCSEAMTKQQSLSNPVLAHWQTRRAIKVKRMPCTNIQNCLDCLARTLEFEIGSLTTIHILDGSNGVTTNNKLKY